jgi:plastocyanin
LKKLIAVAVVAALAITAIPVAFGATRGVRVDDNVFRPSSLTARRGDLIRWRWVGDNPHNVRVTRGPSRFGSRIMRSGSYSRRVRRRGTYRIVCTIHPRMRMTLTVR